MQKNLTKDYIVKSDELTHIATAVKRKRTNKNFTQRELAERANVSVSYISALETQSLSAIRRAKLSRIAKELKCETRDLVGRHRPKKVFVDTESMIPLEDTSILEESSVDEIKLGILHSENTKNRKVMVGALLLSGFLFALLIVTFIWA